MVKILIISYIFIVGIDLFNSIDLRKLVYSFLLSKRNIKGAKKIHLSQTLKNRFTLKYIKDYTIYPREFRFFHTCWIIHICSIIPEYILIIIVNFFSILNASILIAVLVVLKLIFSVLIRMQFSSNRISRFDKRY